jgi:hypothetical protein
MFTGILLLHYLNLPSVSGFILHTDTKIKPGNKTPAITGLN